MKKILVYIFSSLSILFGSEIEETTAKRSLTSRKYVEGEIVIGLKKSQKLEDFLQAVQYIGEFQSIEVGNINYSSYIRDAKPDFINDFLARFDFVDKFTRLRFDSKNGIWNIEFWISGFTPADIGKWKEIVHYLKLKHIPNNSQSILMRVVPGKEKEWIKKMNNLNAFRFVEMNYYLPVV